MGRSRPPSTAPSITVPKGVPVTQAITYWAPDDFKREICALMLMSPGVKCSVATSESPAFSGNVRSCLITFSPSWPVASVVTRIASLRNPRSRK